MLRFITALCFSIILFSTSSYANKQDDPIYQDKIANANLFWDKDFAALQEKARAYLEEKQKFPDGSLRIVHFYRNFRSLSSWGVDEDKIKKVFDAVDTWKEQFPESHIPKIVEAEMVYGFAQSLRADLDDDAEPGITWMPYLTELRRAQRILNSAENQGREDPEWAALSAQVMMDLGLKRSEIERVISEGMMHNPNYLELYRLALQPFLSDFDENWNDIFDLMDKALNNMEFEEGEGVERYVRFVWMLAEYFPDENIFHESGSKIDSISFKQGLEKILKDYPNPLTYNKVAYSACLARDKELTKEAIQKIEEPDRKVWKEREEGYFEFCRRYALDLMAPEYVEKFEPEPKNETDLINGIAKIARTDDFVFLENVIDQYRTKEMRTPAGDWKLNTVYFPFNLLGRERRTPDEFYAEKVNALKPWFKLFPDSPSPYIAKAKIMHSYAWVVRGNAPSAKVSKDAWAPYINTLDEVEMYLRQTKDISSKDPEWYSIMLDVYNEKSVSDKYFDEIYEEGVSKYPEYNPIFLSAVIHSLPKWGGNIKDIETLADEAVVRTYETNGMEMYVVFYRYLARQLSNYNIFYESYADWPKMKQGIKDTLSRYPDPWNINHFAYFSCQAADKEMTAELLKQIEEPYEGVWPEGHFEACQKFAELKK